MSASPDVVAELDRLLLDDPYGEATEATLMVAGDLLQSRGELRGEHIALELAVANARDSDERLAMGATYESWIAQHEVALFGALGNLRHRRGAMRYAFHGGRLRTLFIDARRVITPGSMLRVGELMQVAVASPAVRHLVELRVRVRHESEVREALDAIERGGRKLPLEQLIISSTTRPLGHQTRGNAVDLRKRFPHLWLVTRYARLAPLIDPELPDRTSAHELEQAPRTMSCELRIRIGRALSSGRERTTKAACELLADLGASARVFAPTIELLLRPQVSHAAAWILPALPRFGTWVEALVPRLRRITGDADRYPTEIRSLAGRSLHALEQRSCSPGSRSW